MAWFAGIGAFFWFFRKLVVPHPWGQNYFTDWVARKAVFYYFGPPYFLAAAHVWWPIAAAVLILSLFAAGWRLRWSMAWIGAASIVSAALCAQFLDPNGTWGLILESNSLAAIGSVLAYLSGILLFWRYRRQEPGFYAMTALTVVFVPILQFVGYHYLYWPSAFLAIADACFVACLFRLATELKISANWTLPACKPAPSISADA
jgi:hypothetical protein